MYKLYEYVSLALARVKREEGQGATEYGLVIAFLVIGLAVTIGLLGTAIGDFLGKVGDALNALAP
jgi:Flp pilus assembly pilin Flp